MNIELDLQVAFEGEELPTSEDFLLWLRTALTGRLDEAELSIRLVDLDESQALNFQYRGKDKPTNVLSFPFEMPPGIPEGELSHLLGDLVICVPVVEQEAIEQNKSVLHHWAHLTIHGTLHLLGYDHIVESEAEIMEQLERDLLANLAIPDPYQGIE